MYELWVFFPLILFFLFLFLPSFLLLCPSFFFSFPYSLKSRTAGSLEISAQLQIQFAFEDIIKLIQLHMKVGHKLFRGNTGKRKEFLIDLFHNSVLICMCLCLGEQYSVVLKSQTLMPYRECSSAILYM